MGIKGAILGDIAGSQYEFNHMRPKDLDWKNVPLFTEKCRRTDDSILTLATKGAILESERKGKNLTLLNGIILWEITMMAAMGVCSASG